eukprot:gene14361-16095_t
MSDHASMRLNDLTIAIDALRAKGGTRQRRGSAPRHHCTQVPSGFAAGGEGRQSGPPPPAAVFRYGTRPPPRSGEACAAAAARARL